MTDTFAMGLVVNRSALSVALLVHAGLVRAENAVGEATDGADEVVVRAVREPRPAAEVGLLARDVEHAAGTQGDPAQTLGTLPGVARSGAQAEPVLWGSTTRQTGLFIDDVPIPFLFHGSGIRSVLPAAWISTLRLTPGAYDLALGRRLGGVIRLGTSDADLSAPELAVSADTLDAAAMVGAPLGRTSAARVGGRYGYVSTWLPEVVGKSASQVYAIPDYWDAEAQLFTLLGNGARLKLQLLTAHGRTLQHAPGASPSRETSLETARGLDRIYAVYERPSASGLTRVTPYVGRDEDDRAGFALGVPVGIRREVWLGGLRVDHNETVSDALTARVGIDTHVEVTNAERRGSLSVPGREGDLQVFGRAPGRDYVVEDVRLLALSTAPYVEIVVRIGWLQFRGGVRADTFLLETDRSRPTIGDLPDTGTSAFFAEPSPELALDWAVTRELSTFAALTRHQQPPDALDLGASTGNPGLPPSSAWHALVGETASFASGWSLSALGFTKWLDGLATRTQDPTPAPARALGAEGTGLAYGAQFLVRANDVGGFSGWLSTTLSKSTRRDLPGSAERPFDFDQPVVAALVVTKELLPWRFGTRLRFASGFPRAAVVDADFDLAEDRYDPVLSREQWQRLPPFFALDLRAERLFYPAPGLELSVYAEILNATSQENAEEIAYSWDYRERSYLSGLPLLGVVGLRLASRGHE